MTLALVLARVAGAESARADDRAAAKEILTTLDRSSKDDAVKQAETALERGTRMRNAGDDIHARVAEGLALEWALLARERARTEETEKAARVSEVAVLEAGARVERERALLEEAIARGGRLRAELAALETKEAAPKPKESRGSVAAKVETRKGPKAPKVPTSAPSAQDADAPVGEKKR
jgi:hypothetical protein